MGINIIPDSEIGIGISQTTNYVARLEFRKNLKAGVWVVAEVNIYGATVGVLIRYKTCFILLPSCHK